MKTRKIFALLVSFAAMALSTVSIAQQKKPVNDVSSTQTSTVTPASNTQNMKKDDALNEASPKGDSNNADINEADFDPSKMKMRGAISEQGMPSDQPKLKPATAVTPANSTKPATKPKTESKSSGTAPKQ